MKVLVLGVSGMLGSAVFRQLSRDDRYGVIGTLRTPSGKGFFDHEQQSKIISNLDVLDHDHLVKVLGEAAPDVVINCIGLIKQNAMAVDPLVVLPLNALFPHRLERVCALAGARVVHISTDCVFSGNKGAYLEEDISDAQDLYGKSKYIGEPDCSLKHAVTLRTSIIGHGLNSNDSLVDWFLSQNAVVKGFKKAIFSGLPTVELARVIGEYVLPRKDMHGLYHVSADPIDKYSLLCLISEIYRKKIDIIPDEKVKIDRSLDSTRFRMQSGYQPPVWSELVMLMHAAYTRGR